MTPFDGRNLPAQDDVHKNPLNFETRLATESDFKFCKALYISSMKPLLGALNSWNEKNATAAFKSYFKIDEIRIILVDVCQAGWVQVSENTETINIDQIHLIDDYRCRGIGSQIIKNTMAEAVKKEKPVLLSLIRGNPAIKLYERLGFNPDGKDKTKFHMRWDA